ncbi:EAL domain-containing protein [Dactylosporangium sp. NPDC049525]|uniref:putative bifunctional diguanylate cyclase/phosphodiesterase n=1 Tax=Dactylosporangium sp. NPDC049525 TaxID=3154730 RepID=UPI0034124AEA
MTGSQRRQRFAVAGLAMVLLALTGVSTLGTVATREAAKESRLAAQLAAAYDRAHDALALEEIAEQHYRMEPTLARRAEHADAVAHLDAAVTEIRARGDGDDRALADRVAALQRQYNEGVIQLFNAVDVQDAVLVQRLDVTVIDPASAAIDDLVQTAAAEHATAAARAADRLDAVEQVVFVTTIGSFAAGLASLAGFSVVAAGYQRRLLRQAADSEHQARHDALTGLPARSLFIDRTGKAIDAQLSPSVLMLDLDRFKEVNDTLGHHYGDELLRQVAARTSAAVRSGDTVARLAGDEFAVLLPGTTPDAATDLAQRLQQELHRSFDLGDVTVDIEASVGIAHAPTNADTAESLLRCADIAMYAAKDTKAGVVAYVPSLHTEDSSRLLLLGDLRRALDATDQLTLHYQPKVRLGDGELCGVEALVRWQHPTRGPIAPGEFIPVAENTGLINRLTRYVLHHTLAQIRGWLDAGLQIPVAVNLSPRCLLDANLVDQVTAMLLEYDVPAALLRLEVTESAVMANPALATATLHELHNLGIRLSIDDYGTGYSSMVYLKQLPVDELKVDRAFVLHMDTDRDDAVLVRGAIELGHNLGMTVVAEGVEGSAHVAALEALGCDIAQGYHYARPMPASDVTEWIRSRDLTPAVA